MRLRSRLRPLGWLFTFALTFALAPAASAWRAAPPPDDPTPEQPPAERAEQPDTPAEEPNQPPEAPKPVKPKAPRPTPDGELRPRFELHNRSVKTLLAEGQRSALGAFVPLAASLLEDGSGDEGAPAADSSGSTISDANQPPPAPPPLRQIATWPDTALDLALYSPDAEGRPRWLVRLDWPAADVRARLEQLRASEAGKRLLEGLKLTPRDDGGLQLSAAGETLAFVLPTTGGGALICSHAELKPPATYYRGTEELEKGGPSLIVCRLNLTNTEKDSGATAMSGFAFVNSVEYAGRVGDDGAFLEQVLVSWPPISGAGAKSVLREVKQTFFVPSLAFAALAIDSPIVPGAIEGMAGLDAGGGGFALNFGASPEAPGGTLGSHVEPQACFTVLPGTGFFPVPDIVIQARVKKPDKLIDDIRDAIAERNREAVEREERPTWREAEVADRPVFWNTHAAGGGGLAPASMRPVLFVAKERDAKDRQREFLVLAMVSTAPEDFVRRWLALPRDEKRLFVPEQSKTEGQAWLNWPQLYRWVSPYLNVVLSALEQRRLLPTSDELEGRLSPGWLTLDTRYSGLSASAKGPMPLGAFVIPALAEMALTESGANSDIARERLAARRLKLFHYHARLFRKDIGRWPAEINELDGYIDFAGNPGLLRLAVSQRRGWDQWIEGLSKPREKPTDDSRDDAAQRKDDKKLFVIEVRGDEWRLSVAPGTLDHLESLSIDQEGVIRRVEKPAGAAPASAPAAAQVSAAAE